MLRLRAVLFGLFIPVLLGACASQVPESVRKAEPGGPRLDEVLQAPERFVGRKVRWGGTLIGMELKQGETWLEVVERELGSDGKPKLSDLSGGRFLARVEGFLEPLIYAQGRQITVVGRIRGSTERALEQTTYRYPIVEVESHYLWPQPEVPLCPSCEPVPVPPWYPHPYYHPYW